MGEVDSVLTVPKETLSAPVMALEPICITRLDQALPYSLEIRF